MTQTPSGDYSESALVEQPAIELFSELGWGTADCFHEFDSGSSPLGRETPAEVVLIPRLRAALEKLNPGLSAEAVGLAIEELTRDRSVMSITAANREIYQLLKDGVKVNFPSGEEGYDEKTEVVRIIDWKEPWNNDFFLASQFWVTGEMYKRRADLVGFVNGLPLVLVELKAAHKQIENAFNRNLKDYKDTISHLFWYNGFIILSNGTDSKIGSISAEWEHFNDWKKINSEGEEGIISLETMIWGTCLPERLLDIVENFTLFSDAGGGLVKLVAKNHQYLGVKNVIDALVKARDSAGGRLGVFWHTQGSGKSYSMIFFSQKVLRKMPGNWTFVIVTDRRELDEQIYKNFARAGAVTGKEAHAASAEDLRRLLKGDHRYVFTLIQKFRTEGGEKHPKLSDRSDIIVITDEAHRTQYDIFALNMRNALPHAAFIGFTGTPLMAEEEKTRQVFGDYVSIYNFKQSVDDGATVPLYYENRIPEVVLTNQNLNEDVEKLLEEAELDEEQERKLEREFSREYQLVTRDDRLEKIAEDIVEHFMGRGQEGKAMVVCIDKATAVQMYDKVQKYWKKYLADLEDKLAVSSAEESDALRDKIKYMKETDMAVVVSQSQNEIEEMRKKGLDIKPHRRRMVKEDIDEKFKDPNNPLRVAFVCAMWMTGFDVPCCSTIYLDKPMKNHTLMQTIARANRVFGDKVNGLIVDYFGVFRNLQRALAIYGSGSGGGIREGDTPVKNKAALVEELKKAIADARGFCAERGIELDKVQRAEGFQRVKLLNDAVEAIIINDESKRRYLLLAGDVNKLYRAILPDRQANEFSPICRLLGVIGEKIHSLTPQADISAVIEEVEVLLDESVAAEGYVIGDRAGKYKAVDLRKIDFEALKQKFEKSRKRIEAERLRGLINNKLAKMVRWNKSRMDYLERFQQMIDEYNAGSMNVDEFFRQLTEFAKELNREEKRSVGERLSEEELAVFDLLTKPDMELTKKDRKQVGKVARELLETLKKEKLVLDWRKRQQSRAAVMLSIEYTLDGLPSSYSRDTYREKCDLVYQHIFDSYYGEGRSVYTRI